MPLEQWHEINSQDDTAELLAIFGYFHDGCLREAHLWTKHYVNAELAMTCTGGLDTSVRLLIQRQNTEPSAIELWFEKVVTFHLQPSAENYDSIIFKATMMYQNGIFYWADAPCWSSTKPDRDEVTWIGAKKLSWRAASDWMGSELRYRHEEHEIPEHLG